MRNKYRLQIAGGIILFVFLAKKNREHKTPPPDEVFVIWTNSGGVRNFKSLTFPSFQLLSAYRNAPGRGFKLLRF